MVNSNDSPPVIPRSIVQDRPPEASEPIGYTPEQVSDVLSQFTDDPEKYLEALGRQVPSWSHEIVPFTHHPDFQKKLLEAIDLIMKYIVIGDQKYGDNLAIVGTKGLSLYCLSKAHRLYMIDVIGTPAGPENREDTIIDQAVYAVFKLAYYMLHEREEESTSE